TDDPAQDASSVDKSGVHRGEDWEKLTIVTPLPAGVTNLSEADANVNVRVLGTLLGPGQVDVYPFTVLESGRLIAVVAASGGGLVPRLTLKSANGGVLLTSDSETLDQHLQP